MELKEWQNGLRLCMENIVDLFIDANILINQKKWSRGCFLFITAYEELATAFFILGNFNTPKPKELKKLLWHSKKMAVSSFLTFPASGNVKILQENFEKYIKIDFEKFDLSTDNIYKKEWYKFGDQIQREESLSYWRKYFLYLSLTPEKSNFLSPRSISKAVKAKIAIELYKKLSIAIPILQVLILKLSTSQTKEIDIQEELFKGADMELFEHINLIFEFNKILTTKSIEKIRSFDKVSKKLKDLAVMYISDPSKIKEDQFSFDIFKEFFKDIAPKYQKIWEDESRKKNIELFAEFVGKLNPKMAEEIKNIFIILSKIAKDDLTPDDLHKYFRKAKRKIIVDKNIKHRDKTIRSYILSRNWDKNPEFLLIREVLQYLKARKPELSEFKYVYDYEWEVEPGFSNKGKGDLIFTDGVNNFLVVECKNKNSQEVRQQTLNYMKLFRIIYGNAKSIKGLAVTPERWDLVSNEVSYWDI